MDFLRVNNRNNFLLKEIPEYHPASRAYLNFWKEQKRRCIEGFWSLDDDEINIDVEKGVDESQTGKWRYATPNLYFYVNFGIILHKPEDAPKSAPKKKIKPLLRDVEWEFFYNWLECRGFSGFADDDVYSCNRELVEHIGDNGYEFDEHSYNSKGELKQYVPARDYLRQLHDKPLGLPLYQNMAQDLLWLSARGIGKDLEENTVIHSVSRGEIAIKDVEVGEYIYGADGKPTKVLDRFDFNDQVQYEITLADGRKIISGEGHLWKVIDNYGKEAIVETRFIRDNYKAYIRKAKNGKYDFDSRFFIPMNEAYLGENIDLPIDPYFLGLWLGDGSSHNTGITTIDSQIKDYIYEVVKSFKEHYITINENTSKTCPTYNIVSKRGKENKLLELLRGLNLLKNKHIPEIYFKASKEQRLELLKGLMDSDGYINKISTGFEYTSSMKKLALDVIKLSRGLGIRTEYSTRFPKYTYKGEVKIGKKNYRIRLKPRENVFKLSRKADLFNPNLGVYNSSIRNKVAIKNVERIGVKPSVCIAVDNKDKLFLAGDYVVTHNSFLAGVGVTLHEILFDGAKVYDEESIKNPYKVEVFVGAALSSKSADILKKTEEALLNLPGEYGVNTDSYMPSPLFKKMAGTLSPNNQKNPWRHEYEKKSGGSWKTMGSGSNVKHGIYTIENPEAAAGGRYSVMVVEEAGLLPNALTVQGSNDATMQDAPWKFGSALWIGTGGNVDKIQEFEVMFRDPKGFSALPFDDVWEHSGQIGWFVPSIYAMNQYKDKNGNTNVEKALAVRNKIRKEKGKAKDSSALALEMMNYPLKPSEMFLNAKGSRFPQAELKDHLATVKSKPHYYHNAHYFGEFFWNTEGELKFEITSDAQLVREFPIKDNKNKPGVVEIIVMPKKGADGQVIPGRYVQGTDTYDDDDSTTKSLGSTFVLDLFTNKIVAEYTGRRATKEFYEITRQLNIFYRTKHNYENNKKGLYSYYDYKKTTHLLADTPESLRDVVSTNVTRIGNQTKGTTASTPILAYGLRLLESWLLEPAYGEAEDSNILNLHTIENIGLIEELLNYNDKGNFDRVSAMVMLMVIRENELKTVMEKKEKRISDLAEDDFFSRNWNKKSNLVDRFRI